MAGTLVLSYHYAQAPSTARAGSRFSLCNQNKSQKPAFPQRGLRQQQHRPSVNLLVSWCCKCYAYVYVGRVSEAPCRFLLVK